MLTTELSEVLDTGYKKYLHGVKITGDSYREVSIENSLQVIQHISEQPEFEMTYITQTDKPVTQKIYIIDDGEHCTMLLAEEY